MNISTGLDLSVKPVFESDNITVSDTFIFKDSINIKTDMLNIGNNVKMNNAAIKLANIFNCKILRSYCKIRI